MKIILAGYNLDTETIREFQKQNAQAKHLTPETISAAYARISRSPKSVDELRAIARQEVEKARASNRNIVFEMGHSSVAEHAVFNIDILGVSRLLVEEIEKFRLCSYTEKSQRYVLFKDDFVIPDEIRKAGLEETFVGTIRKQNKFYHELYEKLKPYTFEKHKYLAEDQKTRSILEGWAKEDARYIIAMATETQLGMTINARNLELMLRRLAAHPLDEAREFSRQLFKATKDTAPSLIRYTEATDYDRLTRNLLKEAVDAVLKKKKDENGDVFCPQNKPVTLVYTTHQADEITVASLIHSSSGLSMKQCLQTVSQLNQNDKKKIIKATLRHIKSYDAVLREFEHVDLHFELIVSASCFAQLKRHRMATISSQDYDPLYGVTIPPAIQEIEMEDSFLKIIEHTEAAYRKIAEITPLAASYILTNAHRKRVSMKINARELYHIARLRADRHAQWDIRAVTEEMIALGKKTMPLTLMLVTGKDGFPALYHLVASGDV